MRKTCLPATTAHHKRAGLIGDYQVQSLDTDLNITSYGESFNLQAMSASNGRLMGMLGRGDFAGQSGLVGVSSAVLLGSPVIGIRALPCVIGDDKSHSL